MYGVNIRLLPLVCLISISSAVFKVLRLEVSVQKKGGLLFLLLLLIILPLLPGIVMQGILEIRFLVALPIVFSGLIFLGLERSLVAA